MNHKTLAALGLVVAGLYPGIDSALAQDPVTSGIPQASQLSAHDRYRLASADPVDQQLAGYSRVMPEMGFLRLYGSAASQVLVRLPDLLGSDAENLDYQHRVHQRRNVVEAQLHRISIMVHEDLPSATLFRVGKQSAFDHKYLCVITLNTGPFRKDRYHATRLMVAGHDRLERNASSRELVRNTDFLKFTVDHEVFHCLNAYFNGPAFDITDSNIFSHYQHYISEAEADAFAARIFKKSATKPKEFLERMAALRTMAPLANDFHHFTGDVFRRAIRASLQYESMTLKEQVEASRALASEVAPSASQYREHLATTVALIEQLGRNPQALLSELDGETLPAHDQPTVASLLEHVLQAERLLSGSLALQQRVRID